MSAPTILVVDDDLAVVSMIRQILERAGYGVLTATDGVGAMEKARRDSPDLILLDVIMAGLDGFEVCRILKGEPELRHIPIVLVTASREAHLTEKAFKAGAVLCLPKPFAAEGLLRTIGLALAGRGSPPPPS